MNGTPASVVPRLCAMRRSVDRLFRDRRPVVSRRCPFLARVLRRQLGQQRIQFTDADRRRLAVRGYRLGRQVLIQIATIVTPDTYPALADISSRALGRDRRGRFLHDGGSDVAGVSDVLHGVRHRPRITAGPACPHFSLPWNPGPEFVFVKPRPNTPLGEKCRQTPNRRLVLAVMAKKNVELIGHGLPGEWAAHDRSIAFRSQGRGRRLSDATGIRNSPTVLMGCSEAMKFRSFARR